LKCEPKAIEKRLPEISAALRRIFGSENVASPWEADQIITDGAAKEPLLPNSETEGRKDLASSRNGTLSSAKCNAFHGNRLLHVVLRRSRRGPKLSANLYRARCIRAFIAVTVVPNRLAASSSECSSIPHSTNAVNSGDGSCPTFV